MRSSLEHEIFHLAASRFCELDHFSTNRGFGSHVISFLCEWVDLCSNTKPIGAADILPLFCDITEFPTYFTLGILKKQFSSLLISYENFVRVHSKTNTSTFSVFQLSNSLKVAEPTEYFPPICDGYCTFQSGWPQKWTGPRLFFPIIDLDPESVDLETLHLNRKKTKKNLLLIEVRRGRRRCLDLPVLQ